MASPTFCFLPFLFFVGHVLGSVPEYTYSLYHTRDGLPSANITALAQDSAGFIWVGTDLGLVRYDGEQFQDFFDDPLYRPGTINAIEVDSRGLVWIATSSGLLLYHKGEFRQIGSHGLDTISILCLAIAKDNQLIASTVNNLYALNFALKEGVTSFVNYQQHGILNLTSTPQGATYIGTTTGLQKWDRQTLKTVLDRNQLPDEGVRDVLLLGQDLLIGTEDDNIYKFQTESSDLELIHAYDNYFEDFNSFQYWRDDLFVVFGWAVVHWNEGVASTLYFPDQWDIKFVNCSLTDHDENFWIGSTEGLIRIRRSYFETIKHQALKSEIYSIFEDDDGSLLLGSNHGVIYRMAAGEISPWRMGAEIKGEIIEITKDQVGTKWIASHWDGLVSISQDVAQHCFPGDFSPLGPDVHTLFIDASDQLWLGTTRGVFFKPISSDTFTSGTSKGLPNHCDVYDIGEGRSSIWLATSCGLYRFHENQFNAIAVPNLGESLPIKCILVDEHSIWLGTMGYGLNGYRLQGNRLEPFYSRLDHDRFILSLAANKHEIWACTPTALINITKDNPHASKVYNNKDGFFDEGYAYVELFLSSSDSLYLTTSRGLKKLHRQKKTRQQKYELLINKILVDGQETTLSKSDIELPANSKTFELDFYYPNLSGGEPLQYLWRLSSEESISEWTHSQKISLYSPTPGNYLLDLKVKKGDVEMHQMSLPLHVRSAWYQHLWIQMGCLLLGVVGLIYYLRLSNKKSQLRHDIEAQRALTMASLESKALRAQMNPHFLFNILNNLQEMILSGENNTAHKYLNKFSKLMRMILNLSSKEYVKIEDEIQFLSIYLDLEQLRFDHQIDIKLSVDPEILTEHIPVFMIQPLVENAIRHGLRPTRGFKQLTIQIHQQDDHIRALVIDNGIGISKHLISHKTSRYREVNATDLIRQRLEILSQQSQSNFTLTIHPNTIGVGTIAELLMPTQIVQPV